MDDEESAIVALLHDVVEDAGDRYPMSYLESMGFGDNVIKTQLKKIEDIVSKRFAGSYK